MGENYNGWELMMCDGEKNFMIMGNQYRRDLATCKLEIEFVKSWNQHT